ncbi:hypothetical protein Aperf_G00000088957 [Anoplocephala perfoliata]
MNNNSNLSISSHLHHSIPPPSPNTPVTLTKKPPGSSRTSRYNKIPSTDSHLPPARSYLGLLNDWHFSTSSQHRQRYLQRPGSRIPIAPCFLCLFFSSLLLIADSAVIPGGSITFSRSLNEDSVDLNTTSMALDEFPDIELSDDLSPNDAEGAQDEGFLESEDQGHYSNIEPIDFQKETFVVQGCSRTVKHEEFVNDLVSAGSAQTYSDLMNVDFRKMLYEPKDGSLYVIAKGATLLKLDGKSLALSGAYTVPALPQGTPTCQKARGCSQRMEINVLSRTPQKPFVYYCVLHYEEHSRGIIRQAFTNCVVPNPTKLADNLLMWENPYYSSIDPLRPPVILIPQDDGPENSVTNTPHQPFFYVAGVTARSLQIGRLQMPDYATAQVHWDGALFTPKRSIFINEPATIVMSFETDSAIYFLLRERVSKSSRQSRQVVSRLIRLCRGDRGGLQTISEHYFGTLAKADLICHSEFAVKSANGERVRFVFDFAISAHWDPEARRLYTVFSAGEAAPHGSAVCVYDLSSIEQSFRGPITNSDNILRSNSYTPDDSARPNPFPDICERFAAGNLSAEEIALGQIGSNYLYRFEPINPTFGHAITMSQDSVWSAIIGYHLPSINSSHQYHSSSVIWVMSEIQLTQLTFYESIRRVGNLDNPVLLNTCELRRLRVGPDDSLLERLRQGPNHSSDLLKQNDFPERMSSSFDSHTNSPEDPEEERALSILREGESIYLGTTRALYRLPTDTCSSYMNEETCIASGDPHCGWNNQIYRCVSRISPYGDKSLGFNPAVDGKTLLKCKSVNRPSSRDPNAGWSPWHPCSMANDLHPKTMQASPEWQRSCLCRICLSEVLCDFGEQQVSQCKVPGVWSLWSNWSNCEDKLRFRTRICFNPLLGTSIPSSECVGSDREEEFCLTRPFIPEEVGFEAMRAEQVALKQSSSYAITITRNHLIGMLVGIVMGVLCTLLFIFSFIQFCQPIRRRIRSRTNHPVRLRFHDESRSISNMVLENQIRRSLLHDHPMYANPSPIDRSIHSASSARYNFLLHQSPLLSREGVSNFTLRSIEEPSTTTGFYDRLSENTGK